MQVLLLGSPTLITAGREHVLPVTKQSALLAALALQAGQRVGVERLIGLLWGEEPPPTARNAVQVHVSALRRQFGRDLVRWHGDGYVLGCPEDAIDVTRFEETVLRGHSLADQDQHAAAARVLRAALALWRGEPFPDFTATWFETQRERLRRRRMEAHGAAIRAELALGRHLMLVAELESLVAEHPYDEELAALLMLTLHRAGRTADALAAYREAGVRLRDDLGLEPGSALQTLHAAILRHDPSLQVDADQPMLRVARRQTESRSFVGREALVVQVAATLGRTRCPITLVGPSGVGKTRLAEELAARCQGDFRDGASVIPAATVTGAADLAARVASDLAISPEWAHEVEPRPDALVVIDDVPPDEAWCEAMSPLVDSPGVVWVFTAPRPCGWTDEHIIPVPPLRWEPEADVPGPATRLLLDRAEAAGVDVTGEDVASEAEACAELLDGVPLAIELAAPLATLGLSELHRQLGSASPGRARGPGTSFDSSLTRLSAPEWVTLLALAQCRGPVDGEWLEALGRHCPAAAASGASLVRDGLVRSRAGAHGRPVLEILSGVRHEVVRRAGEEEARAARSAVVRACVDSVAHLDALLMSALETVADSRRCLVLLPVLEGARDAAMELDLVPKAATLVGGLVELLLTDYRPSSNLGGVAWLRARGADALDDRRHAVLVVAEMLPAIEAGDHERVRSLIGEARTLSQSVEDLDVQVELQSVAAAAANIMGLELWLDHDDVVRSARRSRDGRVLAGALIRVGGATNGDELREGLAVSRRLSHAGLTAIALANLAEGLLLEGDSLHAEAVAAEALSLYADMHHPFMTDAMRGVLSTCRALRGSPRDVAELSRVIGRFHARESRRSLADALIKLAASAHRHGRGQLARECLGAYERVVWVSGMAPSRSEQGLVEVWLPGVVARESHDCLDDALVSIQEQVTQWTQAPSVTRPTYAPGRVP